MITREQNIEILNYLFTKKLALDLLIEVEDHFKEQTSSRMDEGMAFEAAFTETKLMWQEDLALRKRLFRGSISKLEHDTLKQVNREKHLETLKYFGPYFIGVLVFAYINPDVSKYLVLAMNTVVGVWCAYLCIRYFKMVQSGSVYYEKRKVSIFQKKMTFVGLGLQALFFETLIYDIQFERFMEALKMLPELSNKSFSFLIPFIYVYCGILGIVSFSDYKKALKVLEKKINLKL